MDQPRSTREIIDDHLELARAGDLERDLERNYAPDVVTFVREGIYRGHAGIRELAGRLADELPDPNFIYTVVLVEREVGFLEWTATSRRGRVGDGADSFVVRDGLIVAQTIHYTIQDTEPT